MVNSNGPFLFFEFHIQFTVNFYIFELFFFLNIKGKIFLKLNL